jgi:hypothetical protein
MEKSELVGKILELKQAILNDNAKIRCMVISVLEDGSDMPVVVYHGDQIEYTVLATETAKALKQKILDRIGQ